MNSRVKRTVLVAALVLVTATAWSRIASPAVAQGTTQKPFALEYSYKVKWGYFDEFKELYIRNHYPILLREQKMGRILSMNAAFPVNHASESGRWDMRFTIVWKDAATAHDGFDSSAIARELYPDQATFKKEEQRRFELLDAHWDVPLNEVDLEKR